MRVNYTYDDTGFYWFDIVQDNEHWDFRNKGDDILDFDTVHAGDDYKSVIEDLNLTIIELFEWID